MADIVVFSTDQSITVEERRKLGMRRLGRVFNTNFMRTDLTDDEIVNKTIQNIIADPDYIATYLDPANILSVKNLAKGTYYFKPGDLTAILKLRATRDKKDDVDNEYLDVMHIALSGGNADLLAADNYLTKVISDLGVANPTPGKQAYLLGTITFRRCR
ncbi:MAG: hypothetical protein ACOH2H_23075 [Cypionkella sp.]